MMFHQSQGTTSSTTGSCNKTSSSPTPDNNPVIPNDTTKTDTTHIDTSGIKLDIKSVINGALVCKRTVLFDTTVVSADSVGIGAIPKIRFESCWRDSQGGEFFYRIYKDSVIFPQDYLTLTLLNDTNEVYLAKGIYSTHRWSDTADYDFSRFPKGCLCGSDTTWKRDKIFSFGFKRRLGVYNWRWTVSLRHSIGDTLTSWGTQQPTIDEIIAGRKAFHAQSPTAVNPDPWAMDTVTYYHILLQYPQW